MHQPRTIGEPTAPVPTERAAAADFSAKKFALVFAVAVIAAFPTVFCGLSSFVVRDFGFFAYPLAHYQRECFWNGELPLWNPYNHCGIPFLAQWNTMPLYPPAILYLVLPLPWSLNLFCLLHLFWAGLGMYQLARRWTGSGLAGAVAGMAFGYNGFALNLLMWPSHIATYSWMPWVVLLVGLGWKEGGRKLYLGILAGSLQMLAGGPETILFTWLVLLVLWLGQLIVSRRGGVGELWPVACRFPFTVLLVACVAAAQLLPFMDLAAHSQREQGFADARWSMPSSGWANFFVPMVFGTSGKQGLFFQHGQYWTSSYYLGLGILVLALAALASRKDSRVWIMAGIAAAGLVLATGDQTSLSRWARRLLPQLSMMTYPVKYVALAIFSVPLIGAFGVAMLEKTLEKSPRRRLTAAAALVFAVVIGVVIWAWRAPFAADQTVITVWNGVGRICVLALTCVGFWLLFKQPRVPEATTYAVRLAPFVVLLVLWVDVRTHEPQQNPSTPTWIFSPGLARERLDMTPEPALGISRAMVSPAAEAKFRSLVMNDPKDNFLVKRLGYFANCNLLDGTPTVNGFYSLAPRECGVLNSLLYVDNLPFGGPLMDFLGVSQSTSTEENTMWEPREGYLPFATAGQAPLFLNDSNALRVLLSTNFNASKLVVLPPESRAWVSATNEVTAHVTPIRIASSRVELTVDAAKPTLVVLSQSYYHNWQARIDNRPERVLRANFAFQAVQMPAGQHRLTLVYEDRAFKTGLVISGFGLLGCLLGWLFSAGPEKRSRAPETAPSVATPGVQP